MWTSALIFFVGSVIASEGVRRMAGPLPKWMLPIWFAAGVILVSSSVGFVLTVDASTGYEIPAAVIGWLGSVVFFPAVWARVGGLIGTFKPKAK
jgi:hypothetical protein